MKTSPVSGALSLAIFSVPLAVHAGDRPTLPPMRGDAVASAEPVKPPPVDISARVIRKAIADSKDSMDDVVPAGRGTFGGAATTAQQRIDHRFKDAEIPTCLTPDATKFDPPMIGPIAFGGFLALPFWMHAIVTGRCRH